MSLSFANIIELLSTVGTRQSVMLLGPPGIGKTALGRALAAEMEKQRGLPEGSLFYEVIVHTSLAPDDLGGLPYREGGEARYAVQDWAVRCGAPGAFGVLILDDLPAASPAVATACRQIVLDRRLHSAVISDDILILVTGNRRQDKAGASQLPSHFHNAVLSLEFLPDLDEWCKWYYNTSVHDPMALSVPAFLSFRKSHFSQNPSQASENGAFATPRTWAKLGHVLHKMEPFVKAGRWGVVLEAAGGLVGVGVATELTAFLKMKNAMAKGEDLMKNPEQALPRDVRDGCKPDEIMAMIASVCEEAATQYHRAVRDSNNELAMKSLAEGLRAIVWVCGSSREYVGMGTQMLQGLGVATARWSAMLKRYESEPWLKQIREFTAASRSRR